MCKQLFPWSLLRCLFIVIIFYKARFWKKYFWSKMWFDLLCRFAWKSFSIQEEFCELSQICEVPATITRFKKLVFSIKTVQVIKILHVKIHEDPFSRSQVFLWEEKDQLTDKTKVTLFAILSTRPTNTRYFLFDLWWRRIQWMRALGNTCFTSFLWTISETYCTAISI